MKHWWKENWEWVAPVVCMPVVVACAAYSFRDGQPKPIPPITTAEQQLGELVLIRKAVENMDRRDQERAEAAERLTKELLGELPGGKR